MLLFIGVAEMELQVMFLYACVNGDILVCMCQWNCKSCSCIFAWLGVVRTYYPPTYEPTTHPPIYRGTLASDLFYLFIFVLFLFYRRGSTAYESTYGGTLAEEGAWHHEIRTHIPSSVLSAARPNVPGSGPNVTGSGPNVLGSGANVPGSARGRIPARAQVRDAACLCVCLCARTRASCAAHGHQPFPLPNRGMHR